MIRAILHFLLDLIRESQHNARNFVARATAKIHHAEFLPSSTISRTSLLTSRANLAICGVVVSLGASLQELALTPISLSQSGKIQEL